MEINSKSNNLYWVYAAGFFLILALPVLITRFLFFPPDWGKAVVFRSVAAILLFLFLWQIFFKNAALDFNSLKSNRIIWLLLIFLGVNLLATIFSADVYFSLWGGPERAGGLINLSFFVVFTIAVFLLVKKNQWQKIWDFVLGVGIVVALIGVVQQFGIVDFFVTQEARMPSTMGNPILLAIYLMMLFFMALAFLLKEERKNKRWFYIIALAIFSWIVFTTGARAAWLGLAVGLLYFFLLYPSGKRFFKFKIKYVKLVVLALFVLLIAAVFIVNSIPDALSKAENNRVLRAIAPRLSFDLFLKDPRFSAWQVSFNSFLDRPLLGWGPENLSIGFDKNYDPSLPYLDKYWGGWYDRAHNFVLETLATTGILGLLAYLTLVGMVFWWLHKFKTQINTDENTEKHITMAHGVQATFIAYLAANFFSFDSFSTYLTFFILIAYSLRLTSQDTLNRAKMNTKQHEKKSGWKIIFISALFLLLAWFLWTFNLNPLLQNRQINEALNIGATGHCQTATELINKATGNNTILNHYARIKYLSLSQDCVAKDSTENISYSKRGIELLEQEDKMRSSYTRLWIWLGALQNQLIVKEPNLEKKAELAKKAAHYFKRALVASPNRQEIYIEWAKLYMSLGEFEKMKEKALLCRDLNPELDECYWFWGLAEIAMGNLPEGKKLLAIAEEKRVWPLTLAAYHQLIVVYSLTENQQVNPDVAKAYEAIMQISQKIDRPVSAQDHASYAFVLAELGRYKEAREQALIFLKEMPEARGEVILFLQSLPAPYQSVP